MPDGLRLAITTLTVLPVHGPRRIDRRCAGQAMAWAPLVGLCLGGAASAVLVALRSSSGLLAAVAALATLALLTRGLHLDGLADTADGLGSYLPADQARAVMKTPEVGALGMVTVVLTLGLQAAALSAAGTAAGLVVATVVGRIGVCAACTPATPAAGLDGLGAMVAGTVRPAVPGLWMVAAAAGSALVDPVRGPVAMAAGLLCAYGLRRHAVRRLGGITGDVLGACLEVATTTTLIVLAVR